MGFSIGSSRFSKIIRNDRGILIKTAGYNIVIRIDIDRVLKSLANKKFCDPNRNFRPVGNAAYSILPIKEIVAKYNSVQLGIANYYLLHIDRVDVFYRIMYIIQYSCYGTIAKKLNSSIFKIFRKYGKPPTFEFGVRSKTLGTFGPITEVKKITVFSTDVVKKMVRDRGLPLKGNTGFTTMNFVNWRTYKNLTNPKCLICGSSLNVEWHHVNRIKNVKATGFTKVMQQLNRKVIPLCHKHHVEVEHGKYSGAKLADLVEVESWLI